MSPRVFRQGELIFWFHSYDALHENRASIHVGKGSQNDATDAKIWLEPTVELARAGRVLTRQELRRALVLVEANANRLVEAWYAHRGKAS